MELDVRVQELEAILSEAISTYYSTDETVTPTLSDHEFDTLLAELRFLDPENPIVQKVGGAEEIPMDNLDLWLQREPMKSINPIFSWEDAQSYNLTMGTTDRVAMLKADGHSGRAIYARGNLVRATTRGRNGRKGKDITAQMKLKLPNVISELSDVELFEVRFEILMTFDAFEELKRRYPDRKFSNPRNSVATLLKESFEPADLDLMHIQIYRAFWDTAPDSLTSRLRTLMDFGFPRENLITVYQLTPDTGLEELPDLFAEIKEACPYLTDGLVARLDSEDAFQSLGGDEKYDDAQVALKFGPWGNARYCSIINEYEWSYGKQYITPMALIEPVFTPSGKRVSRVSLQNVRNLQYYLGFIGRPIWFEYVSEINPKLVEPTEEELIEFFGEGNIPEEYRRFIEQQGDLISPSFDSEFITDLDTAFADSDTDNAFGFEFDESRSGSGSDFGDLPLSSSKEQSKENPKKQTVLDDLF